MRGTLLALACALALTVVVPPPAGAAPPGYRVVIQGPVWRGLQDWPLAARCPAGTVVLDGGGLLTSSSVTAYLGELTDWDTPAWAVHVEDPSGSTGASAFAVCAAPPAGYDLLEARGAVLPPYGQAAAWTACPAGTVPLGGGAFSDDIGSGVNSSLPDGNGWLADITNPTSADDGNAHVVITCGVRPPGYAVVYGPWVATPPRTQTPAFAACPTGTVPIGGGAFSTSSSDLIMLNSSYPYAGGWQIWEDNATTTASGSVESVAVCAS
jgi:hypothetical protein